MTMSSNANNEPAVAKVLQDKGKDIYGTVRQCVAEIMEQPIDTISPESSLLSLGADSFHFVDLVFRLEREFDVAIDRRYAVPHDHNVDTFVVAVAEAMTKQGR
jgi:acyl carrier protein